MLLRTALLFFAISLFCFGADNGIQLKGIKSVENREIQFFIKKGENIDTKSKEIIDMERVSAVSKFYPIKISGNGNDTIQMKAFEKLMHKSDHYPFSNLFKRINMFINLIWIIWLF